MGRDARAGLAATIQKSLGGKFPQRPVDRRPGATKSLRKFGLLGDLIAGFPFSIMDAAQNFVMHGLPSDLIDRPHTASPSRFIASRYRPAIASWAI